MDADGVRALLTPEGAAALAAAAALPDPADTLASITALRAAGHDAGIAADALTQITLRAKAGAKFGDDAASMFFTPAGLEQATRSLVAARRARRFADAGVGSLIDVGCGVGSDLIAAARAGIAVRGWERDPLTAAVARANVAATGCAHLAAVELAEASAELLPGGADAVFCDPARRGSRGRTFDPRAYSPPFDLVETMLRAGPHGAAKLAPGFPHDAIPTDAEAEWVSVGGELVEMTLWLGGLAVPGRRGATVLTTDSAASLLSRGQDPPAVGAPGRYLYEPDAAVIRSHLVAEFATDVGGSLLDPTIAYVTADNLVATPFGRAYEIIHVLGFSVKRLRTLLRERDIGSVTIKKRGTAVTPEQLRPQLKLIGGKPAVLVLSRIEGRHSVLLCKTPE